MLRQTTIEALPAEILALVLNVHLARPWRPLAARTCHSWRATVALDAEAALQRVARRHGKATADEVYVYTARRANPLIIGKPTLAAAAAGSHLDLLRWLLKHPRVRACGSIVRAAAYAGATDAVAFFLKRKPGLVRAAARYAAARGGQRALLEWFLARDLGHHSPSDSDCDVDDSQVHSRKDIVGTKDGDDDGNVMSDGSDSSDDDSCCDDGDVPWAGNPLVNHMGDADDADEFVDRDAIWPAWHVDGGMHSSACDCSGSGVTDEAGTDEVEDWWGPNMCANAARGGHLDLLKWLRGPDVRCRWDAWTTSAAAAGGHVEVLSWALTQCTPPCRMSHWRTAYPDDDSYCETITWAARAPRNNVEALAIVLSTGYAPTLDDLRQVLVFGRTDMASLILNAHPHLWQPDKVPWWSHGRDERRPEKTAGQSTLLWAIEQLDKRPATWDDTVEIALTYAAIVHDCANVVDALRSRGRCRLGDQITEEQERSVRPWGDVATPVRTGKRVAH